MSAGAGVSGVSYTYLATLRDRWGAVELTIDTADKDRNKRLFDLLASMKGEIESDFGDTLEWIRNDNLKVSNIRKVVIRDSLGDEGSWPTIHEEMIDAMSKLAKATKSRLASSQGRII